MNTFVLLAMVCFDTNKQDCQVFIADYDLSYEDCQISQAMRSDEYKDKGIVFTCEDEVL